jgi:protein-S-isoprenylcysteine O-methyltransferase Ste14
MERSLANIIKNKNFLIRLMIFLLVLIPMIFFNDFLKHITSHFTGSILPNLITEQWHIVLINIVMFITFLIPLSFRRKIDWKEYGLVTAFFVSLFIEMYGIPFTILFASKSIYTSNVELASVVYEFEFLGVNIAMDLAMVYASILIVIGTVFIVIGWITLYKKIKTEEFVTTGIYSYSRHPQYFGFILIIFGWLIGWPTILTVLFAFILIYKYVKVCRVEEKDLSRINNYQAYKKKVPFFI